MSWSITLTAEVGDLSLDVILDGEQAPVALVGPNGAGKTSLLRLIAGARRASGGRIQIGDDVVYHSASGKDLPPESRGVGYVPQGYGLFQHLRAVDNVAFGLASAGVRRRERRERAQQMLDELGVGHLADRVPGTLSGGEQQRVALARALAVQPRLLLLDEPLAALDATARRETRAFLTQHLGDRGIPALIVTHDLRDILALNAEVAVLEQGRIVQRGRPDALAAAPASVFVAELFEVLTGP